MDHLIFFPEYDKVNKKNLAGSSTLFFLHQYIFIKTYTMLLICHLCRIHTLSIVVCIIYIVLSSVLVCISPPCILLLYFDILLYILINNFTFPTKKSPEYRQTIETRGINKESFTLKDILLKYQEKFKMKDSKGT